MDDVDRLPSMTVTARGTTTAYVGSNQLFYYAMGFAPYETGTRSACAGT